MDISQAYAYIALWATACFAALGLYIRDRKSYALSHPAYWHFILVPWKVITFVIAATAMAIIAPYSGDPTWDYADALFMSVFTFSTGPWVVGVMYRTIRHRVPFTQAFVALCVWMFSASWSYDLYILVRDGYYPQTWSSNLVASSFLYLCGGMFWSLDWKAERGVVFAFMDNEWPAASSDLQFSKIIWYVLLFVALVSFMILPFLCPEMKIRDCNPF